MKAAWNLNSNQTVPENRYVPCSTLLTNTGDVGNKEESVKLLYRFHATEPLARNQRASECRTTAFYAGFPRMSRSREIAFFNNVYRLQAVADVAAAIKPGFYDIGDIFSFCFALMLHKEMHQSVQLVIVLLTKGVHLPEFPQYLLKFLFAYQIPLCKTKRGGLEDTYPDDILEPILKVWFSKSVDGMVMFLLKKNISRLQAVADVSAAIKPPVILTLVNILSRIGAALLLLDPTSREVIYLFRILDQAVIQKTNINPAEVGESLMDQSANYFFIAARSYVSNVTRLLLNSLSFGQGQCKLKFNLVEHPTSIFEGK
ncbi:hypothetical protein Tco_1093735 [Tanacetum coccineum]|uniref:Uncharacterized protein n=1 Tax=Tanacetum coccineum TaxID=301880 RepID=A0ABQ5IFL2_9ASTR